MKYVWSVTDRITPDLIFYFTSERKALRFVELEAEYSPDYIYLVKRETVR